MAKKIFTTYRAPVNSFPLGEQNIGMSKSGRYSGFDSIITRGALDISIIHTNKVRKTGKDNIFENNFGSLLFPTGTIVHDDDDIELTVASNSGGANKRIDFVIAENTYQEISGGSPIIYSIIQGPGDGTKPVLSNPEKQVKIGVIEIDANGYLFTNIKYTPTLAPLPGDITYEDITQIIINAFNIPVSDTNTLGIVKRSTQVEVNTGNEDTKYVTPKGLHNKKSTKNDEGIIKVASFDDIKIGTSENMAISPKEFRGLENKVPLNADYILTENDFGKIFLGMGATTITVTVPPSLGDNVHFGFLAVSCNIQLVASGTTIGVQVGKKKETKELNTGMLLESTGTNTYSLIGNLKPL